MLYWQLFKWNRRWIYMYIPRPRSQNAWQGLWEKWSNNLSFFFPLKHHQACYDLRYGLKLVIGNFSFVTFNALIGCYSLSHMYLRKILAQSICHALSYMQYIQFFVMKILFTLYMHHLQYWYSIKTYFNNMHAYNAFMYKQFISFD